jgi:hypothetical protein
MAIMAGDVDAPVGKKQFLLVDGHGSTSNVEDAGACALAVFTFD